MKLMHLAVTVILLTGPVAFAQGSGSTEGNAASSDNFQVTRSFEGKVMQVKIEDSVIVVKNKEGEHHDFHFTGQTEIASSKNETGGEPLKASALKPGERVKVVFRPSDMHAVRLRVLN